MTKTGEEEERGRMRERMLHCADVYLKDAENISVSRHTRVEACFDSILLRFLVLVGDTEGPEPREYPSERVIVAGAAAAGLEDESLEDVLELHRAVADFRHKPGTHSVNMLHILALARHIAKLVKAATVAAPVLTHATGKASAGPLTAEAILAPSELDTIEMLLKHLAKVFNHDGGGREEDEMTAVGMAAVAATLVDLGFWLRLHQGEPACELVAYWLEKQGCRVPPE